MTREPPARALSLDGLEPFAKGTKRHCYVHPDDACLCVKVPARADDPDGRARQWRDLAVYASMRASGPEEAIDRIPAIEGVVHTDLGLGLVQLLCRDADGRISRTLLALIREGGLTPSLAAAVEELKRWQRERGVLVRDMTPTNVVAMRLGRDEWKPMIVDGFRTLWRRRPARRPGVLAGYRIRRVQRAFDRMVAAHMEAVRRGAGSRS